MTKQDLQKHLNNARGAFQITFPRDTAVEILEYAIEVQDTLLRVQRERIEDWKKFNADRVAELPAIKEPNWFKRLLQRIGL